MEMGFNRVDGDGDGVVDGISINYDCDDRARR